MYLSLLSCRKITLVLPDHIFLFLSPSASLFFLSMTFSSFHPFQASSHSLPFTFSLLCLSLSESTCHPSLIRILFPWSTSWEHVMGFFCFVLTLDDFICVSSLMLEFLGSHMSLAKRFTGSLDRPLCSGWVLDHRITTWLSAFHPHNLETASD